MRCLIRWYCGRCKEEYADYTDETGTLKAKCPKCKEKTNFNNIFELETLQVG